jgi:hypothetical protein
VGPARLASLQAPDFSQQPLNSNGVANNCISGGTEGKQSAIRLARRVFCVSCYLECLMTTPDLPLNNQTNLCVPPQLSHYFDTANMFCIQTSNPRSSTFFRHNLPVSAFAVQPAYSSERLPEEEQLQAMGVSSRAPYL